MLRDMRFALSDRCRLPAQKFGRGVFRKRKVRLGLEPRTVKRREPCLFVAALSYSPDGGGDLNQQMFA